MSNLSEVRIVISQKGEKFTGHVFADSTERLTMEHNERTKAVNQAFQIARNALMEDNVLKVEADSKPAESQKFPSDRGSGTETGDSRSKSGK